MRDHRPPVLSDYDWWNAMYDYMIEQLDGRFRLQFPNHVDILDMLVHNMRHPLCRIHEDVMCQQIKNVVSLYGSQLTNCMLKGCENEENHEFIKEFIELVWGVRYETEQWLSAQGIVIGQSFN